MFTETIIKAIEDLHSRKEYRNLTGISKTVVDYLLKEVKEASKGNKLAVKNCIRRQSSIPLFEIKFSYNAVYISTIYKYSASHIKCMKYCKKTDAEEVMHAIETVCAILTWNVDLEREKPRQVERNMKIGYNIPKETNP